MKTITGYKCTNCGRVMFPRHERCLNCNEREFKKVEPTKRGKLLTLRNLQKCRIYEGVESGGQPDSRQLGQTSIGLLARGRAIHAGADTGAAAGHLETHFDVDQL